MRSRIGIITFLFSFYANLVLGGIVFWTDSFESGVNPTSGMRVTSRGGTDGLFSNDGDYFFRTDDPGDGTTSGFGQTFTNQSGVGYWRAEDLNGSSQTNPAMILWGNIDISGQSGLSFSGLFGARPMGFESETGIDDGILIEASIDGNPFFELMEFRPTVLDENAFSLARDTNNDSIGDLPLLGTALIFQSTIFAGSGSLLDLRITVHADDSQDEVAFDHFTLSSAAAPAAVPEPAAIHLLLCLMLLVGLIWVRQQRNIYISA